MKSVTVLVFVLTIIHYLDIGDAISSKKIKAIEEKEVWVKRSIVIFMERMDELEKYLREMRDAEIPKVKEELLTAKESITGYPTFYLKENNKDAIKCIKTAIAQLKVARRKIFQSLNGPFRFQNEQIPRVNQYKNIIRKLEKILPTFKKILDGAPANEVAYYDNQYVITRRAVTYLNSTIASTSIVTGVSTQVEEWKGTLLKKINNIKKNAIECIGKA